MADTAFDLDPREQDCREAAGTLARMWTAIALGIEDALDTAEEEGRGVGFSRTRAKQEAVRLARKLLKEMAEEPGILWLPDNIETFSDVW